MKRFIQNTVFLFILTVFPLHIAYAETTSMVIRVVDVEYILTKSKASLSVQKQVEQKRKVFLDNVKKKEAALIQQQKDIEKGREKLSQEEFIKKAKGFEKQRIETRNTIQKEKIALDKSYAAAMTKITDTIVTVTQEIANEKKIDLVVTRQNIIVGSMALDITKDVMDRLNKKLPKLSLK